MEVNYYIDGKLLDLFEEDSVFYSSKLIDVEKLSNIFADYTNTLTIPSTPNNDEIFRHYWDVDIDDTFNANIKVTSYIELNTMPFRYGKTQLEGVKRTNDNPDSYKISFYGGAIQITDLFKEDTLDRLDYVKDDLGVETETFTSLSQFDYLYNSTNFINSINNPTFKNGDLITPLIGYTNRDWNFGTGDALDITTDAGAINVTELRQGLRVIKIIEAIEEKYGITFSRDFFGRATFLNAFLWLNQRDGAPVKEFNYPITESFLGSDPNNDVSIDSNGNVNIRRIEDSFSSTTSSYITEYSTCKFTISPSLPNSVYNVSVLDALDNVISTKEGISGTQSIYATQRAKTFSFTNTLTTDVYKLRITPSTSITFETDILARRINRVAFGATTVIATTVSNDNVLVANITISTKDNMPKMKVTEFIQGLLKAFKLVIRPLSEKSFYVDTLNSYYDKGDTIDITEYVNLEEITYDRPEIYKNVTFKYQKTNNVAGKKFRTLNDSLNDEIGYGDLKATYASIDNKNDLKVELPFENMLFERMRVQSPHSLVGEITNISIGQSISSSDEGITFSPNKSKPIIFFNNGLANNTDYIFKVRYDNDIATVSYNYIIGSSNDEIYSQVTDSLNFSNDIDPWHLQPMNKNLYSNYWDKWIQTIYSTKQRKISVPAILPLEVLDKLSLNDRLIIKSNRFKISDHKVNLSNGETQFTLFNDIYLWNGYELDSRPSFTSYAFSPDPYYIIDTLTVGNQIYIYGTFTAYNGVTANRIIKLNINGSVDTTFNTGSGFNANSFGFQSLQLDQDGKILVSGDFTSYNGTAKNRIIRLNTDGSIDSTFVIGSGFNSITSGLAIDSNNSIIVGGSYGSYNGNSVNRIARLLPNGTLDSSFSIGIGFNNVTNDVTVNENNDIYVTGYFTSYNGSSSNKIIKLLENGSVDTSFNVGSGLNSSVGQPNGVIMFDRDSILVYGYFTSYNGTSINRMARINSDGTINTNFNIGTGFNNAVYSVKPVLNGKILVTGFFTSYNGVESNGSIILNSDGSIYRNITTAYTNIYNINGYIYGQIVGNSQELFLDATYPLLSTNGLVCNAGGKYFDIDIYSKKTWFMTKLDTGYGTDWIDTDINNNTCVIKVAEKASQTPPDVYESRTMDLMFNIEGEISTVRILQIGL